MNIRIVYDLGSQPFSVGDVLTYQGVSLILREQNKADKVDFHILYEGKPLVSRMKIRFDPIENFGWLLGAARVNEFLGEAKVVDKWDERELSWPERSGYMVYACIDIVKLYFKKFGRILPLRPRSEARQWAREYLDRHGRVTVQMRRNANNPARNSDYPVWVDFMRGSDESFVVVCAPHEVDESLRLPNVTIACDDVGTDTEKICALVGESDFHLGVSSGPATMRWFSDKPFMIFKDQLRTDLPWLKDSQVMTHSSESREMLEEVFA